MKLLPLIAAVVVFVILAGCAVGPDYKRPKTDVPSTYRRAESDTNTTTSAVSIGDMGWWQAYTDPQLSAYIGEVLTNNYDIKIAAARVLQAEAAVRIERSAFFPTVNAGADWYTVRSSQEGPIPLPAGVQPKREFGDVFAAMSAYEVDLWGRVRRANEAARARLLATKDAQQTVRQTLVAAIATSYLNLLELDLELEISERTRVNRSNSLELTKSREQGGVAAMQDVYQAEILVYTTDAAIADIQRRIEQNENEISILLGRNPHQIQRGEPLTNLTMSATVPVGLSSALLERRPDIRAAEQFLHAANADIGQAKAAFFPRITLTGFYGFQSTALSDLFTGPARTWQFGPTVSLPLFTGGRLQANLALARAQFDEALAGYQATVQNAFREVSDALIAYQRIREFRIAQEKNTQAHRNATSLAYTRYDGGVTSYLEVLYNEQELFNSELILAQARRGELQSVVQLYRALGGGWQQEAPEKKTAKR